MQIVWFKRDLRIFDNEAFKKACDIGPIIPLYIFEEDLDNEMIYFRNCVSAPAWRSVCDDAKRMRACLQVNLAQRRLPALAAACARRGFNVDGRSRGATSGCAGGAKRT